MVRADGPARKEQGDHRHALAAHTFAAPADRRGSGWCDALFLGRRCRPCFRIWLLGRDHDDCAIVADLTPCRQRCNRPVGTERLTQRRKEGLRVRIVGRLRLVALPGQRPPAGLASGGYRRPCRRQGSCQSLEVGEPHGRSSRKTEDLRTAWRASPRTGAKAITEASGCGPVTGEASNRPDRSLTRIMRVAASSMRLIGIRPALASSTVDGMNSSSRPAPCQIDAGVDRLRAMPLGAAGNLLDHRSSR